MRSSHSDAAAHVKYLAQHLGAARYLYPLLPRLEDLRMVVGQGAGIDKDIRHKFIYVPGFMSYNNRNVTFIKVFHIGGLYRVAARDLSPDLI